MKVERTNESALQVKELPDGSKVIFDSSHETVVALNTTAGAAWDACKVPTTLSNVAEHMRHSLHSDVTDEIAANAIRELEGKNLVATSGMPPQTTRREMMATLGAIALPLVVSLTMTEQKAYAATAVSGNIGGKSGDRNDFHRTHERLSKPWASKSKN